MHEAAIDFVVFQRSNDIAAELIGSDIGGQTAF
jgi:hypothetical protein